MFIKKMCKVRGKEIQYWIRLNKSFPKNSKIYGYLEQVEIDVRKYPNSFLPFGKLKDVVMAKNRLKSALLKEETSNDNLCLNSVITNVASIRENE